MSKRNIKVEKILPGIIVGHHCIYSVTTTLSWDFQNPVSMNIYQLLNDQRNYGYYLNTSHKADLNFQKKTNICNASFNWSMFRAVSTVDPIKCLINNAWLRNKPRLIKKQSVMIERVFRPWSGIAEPNSEKSEPDLPNTVKSTEDL